ncbi:MAG: hypothetical protein RR486_06905 [Clostridium sp.]|uniref:hypothetical protein n=1 Tax=Clostridium sp. TaxID=1506 RepID=UPI00302B463D
MNLVQVSTYIILIVLALNTVFINMKHPNGIRRDSLIYISQSLYINLTVIVISMILVIFFDNFLICIIYTLAEVYCLVINVTIMERYRGKR